MLPLAMSSPPELMMRLLVALALAKVVPVALSTPLTVICEVPP